jgi:MOSC domain-containing protein YiiM
MKILTIQVALPKTMGTEGAPNPFDRPWTSAFAKEPVAGPVRLTRTTLEGDAVADTEGHGGPEQAVLCYAAGHYPPWRAELYLELPYGGFGENFTVSGGDETTVCIGDVYRVGSARVQVSQPRLPCWKISRRWRVKDLSARVERTGRTGWYLRVLKEGMVAPGDEMVLEDHSHPEWTVLRAFRAITGRPRDLAEMAALADVDALAPATRDRLRRYAARPSMEEGDHGRLVGPNAL